MKYLVVGLGNPGERYAGTRHNAGFMAIDRLERELEESEKDRVWHLIDSALVVEGTLAGKHVILAKPQTYMNASGSSVVRLVKRFNVEAWNLLLIYDDVSLPLGRLRLRRKGSAGGHNGVRSVIDALETENFPRLRIGIGNPEEEHIIDYVLGDFSAQEMQVIDRVIQAAVGAVKTWLTSGIDRAMSEFNGEIRAE